MACSLSVIVPVYNCELFLKRAIESVISQDKFSQCELILIDDGSTDTSPLICDDYSATYPNILTIHQSNSGVSSARNKGIELSTGEWICFLDSDDYLLPGALDLIDSYYDSDIICSSHCSNDESPTNQLNLLKIGSFDIVSIKEELVKTLSSGQYFYPCWAKYFKRSLIINNCIYFPTDRKLAEDMVFVYTYLLACKRITVSEKATYFYNINENNTTNVVKESYETFKFILKWKKEYFKKLECLSDEVSYSLIDSFVWNCFLSFKSNATYSGFFESVKELNEIFQDNKFFDLYLLTDYKEFKTLTDKLLDWSIRNKNSVPFCLMIKFNNIKSKIISIIKR